MTAAQAGTVPLPAPSAPLVSVRKLEHLVGRERTDIDRIANHAGRYYHPFDRRRQRGVGKWRHIDNPAPELKGIQKKILKNILSARALPDSMFGGAPGRTVKDNAGTHVGQSLVVTLDLRDCFPSLDDRRVYRVFRQDLGCSTEIASTLTKLTTFQHRVPQGAPTSLALANLCLLPLYSQVEEIAHHFGLSFSFFVDDIALSGDRARMAIDPVVRAIQAHGLSIAQKKLHRMPSGGPQRVTGLNVNQKIAVPKEKRRALRREILMVASMEAPPDHLLQSIKGKIAFVMSVAPTQGMTLLHLARKYLPERGEAGKRPRTDEIRPCTSFARHRHRSS